MSAVQIFTVLETQGGNLHKNHLVMWTILVYGSRYLLR